MADGMNEAETRAYCIILAEELSTSMLMRMLEPHFDEVTKEYHKDTAIGMVRIRNDMDERMREFRNKPKRT